MIRDGHPGSGSLFFTHPGSATLQSENVIIINLVAVPSVSKLVIFLVRSI
jgi:hypothetical protein